MISTACFFCLRVTDKPLKLCTWQLLHVTHLTIICICCVWTCDVTSCFPSDLFLLGGLWRLRNLLRYLLSGGYAWNLLFGSQHRRLLGFGFCINQGSCVRHLSLRCIFLFSFLLLFPLLLWFGCSTRGILSALLFLWYLPLQTQNIHIIWKLGRKKSGGTLWDGHHLNIWINKDVLLLMLLIWQMLCCFLNDVPKKKTPKAINSSIQQAFFKCCKDFWDLHSDNLEMYNRCN